MDDPAFGDYGWLIFPSDVSIGRDLALRDVEDILMWYRMSLEWTSQIIPCGEVPRERVWRHGLALMGQRNLEKKLIRQIRAQGTDAEIEVFDGLRHGFGLGEGTVAEGWIDRAVSFWERNMQKRN